MWIRFSKGKNKKATHAGGIVYRDKSGSREYLLVSAKNFSFIWVLPKGHIERSETEAEAAIREVKEESGMEVSIIRKIGNTGRLKWNFEKQIVAFYLMEFQRFHSANKEKRKVSWLPLDHAIKRLFYEDQKKIMRQLKV